MGRLFMLVSQNALHRFFHTMALHEARLVRQHKNNMMNSQTHNPIEKTNFTQKYLAVAFGIWAYSIRQCRCVILPNSVSSRFALAYFLGVSLLILTLDGGNGLGNLTISAPVGHNIIPIQLSLFSTALIANLPQVLLSYIYVAFNSLFTCMLAGQEYMQYFHHRRPLRVTSPIGQQRSTYYLQLPYQYSLTLLAFSSLLSWLVAQSLFVVRVQIRDPNNLLHPDSMISSCGYSSGAIMLTIVVGTLIVLATGATGWRKYPAGMPLVATCRGAISAACHPPLGDENAAVLPVQWGVVSIKDGVGHCSYSSTLVAPPIPGQRYE